MLGEVGRVRTHAETGAYGMLRTKMSSNTEPQSQTLAERVARKLRGDILSGRIQPGERLPAERDIAATFDASLPTVRGALRQLVAQGLINSKRGPRGGYFVGRPSVEHTERAARSAIDWLVMSGIVGAPDVLEAHHVIGTACGRLAAQRRSDMDLFRIEQAVIKMSDSSLSNELFCASEAQLSRLIASASGNSLLRLVNLLTSRAFSGTTRRRVFAFHERHAITRIARSIAAAIRARQTQVVEARLNDYFECFRAAMMSDDLPGAAPDPSIGDEGGIAAQRIRG